MKSSKLFLFFLTIASAGCLQAIDHPAAKMAVDPSKRTTPIDLEGEIYWYIMHCDYVGFDGTFQWHLSRIDKLRCPQIIQQANELAHEVLEEKEKQLDRMLRPRFLQSYRSALYDRKN